MLHGSSQQEKLERGGSLVHMLQNGRKGQAGYVAQIPELVGNNYKQWRKLLNLALLMLGIDSMLTSPCPKALEALVRGENETDAAWEARESAHAKTESEYQLQKRRWELDNKKCLAIMQTKMTEAIKASIPEKNASGVAHTAAEFLAIVESQHSHHTKTYASTTIGNLVSMKYTGGGVRDHILKMSNMNGKLAEMGMSLPDEFVVHLVFKSLPPEFSAFEVNYNTIPDKWDMHKLIAMCVQEEDRLKAQNGGSINYVHHSKKPKKSFPSKNYPPKNQWESGPSNAPSKPQAKAPVQVDQSHKAPEKQEFAPNQCMWCKKMGHWKKECPGWLRHMWSKGYAFQEDPNKRRKKN